MTKAPGENLALSKNPIDSIAEGLSRPSSVRFQSTSAPAHIFLLLSMIEIGQKCKVSLIKVFLLENKTFLRIGGVKSPHMTDIMHDYNRCRQV